VTNVNAAIILPDGISGPMSLTFTGTSVGSSSALGPGLVVPAGVRSDALYFSVSGNGAPDNRLCSAIDPPIKLGDLVCDVSPSACAIGGTALAVATLTTEGVGDPGFMLPLAEDAMGPIPLPETQFVNGVPFPIVDLKLGPAVTTAGGTRWEVLLQNATAEFHRVGFGLIAPLGTTTSGMRWVGCDTVVISGVRTCIGGAGFGTTVNPAASWTVGPQASAPGDQLEHTLYVVLEGNRPSQFAGINDGDTLNPENAGSVIVLGTVELDANPDLEPALTTDGVSTIDDLFNTGTPVAPFELSEDAQALPDVTQVKLIGEFNPADDVDSDGIQDLADNCPFIVNASQLNRGSYLSAEEESDFLGDACQCGEGSGDGAVFEVDFEIIRDYLTGKIAAPGIAAAIEERCSVVGTTECNMQDLLYLRLAIGAGNTPPQARCDAALSPVTPAP
jgi:hypothetical protein